MLVGDDSKSLAEATYMKKKVSPIVVHLHYP